MAAGGALLGARSRGPDHPRQSRRRRTRAARWPSRTCSGRRGVDAFIVNPTPHPGAVRLSLRRPAGRGSHRPGRQGAPQGRPGLRPRHRRQRAGSATSATPWPSAVCRWCAWTITPVRARCRRGPATSIRPRRPPASSSTRWRLANGWPVTVPVARALYVALVTDTGGFRFSNTHPRTLRIAADLLETGIDPESIYLDVYAGRARRPAQAAGRYPADAGGGVGRRARLGDGAARARSSATDSRRMTSTASSSTRARSRASSSRCCSGRCRRGG